MKDVDAEYELHTERIHDDMTLSVAECHLCTKFELLTNCVESELDDSLIFCSVECLDEWERLNALDYFEIFLNF